MADAKTARHLNLRSRLKRWTLPVLAALAGVAAKITFDYSPLAALLNLTQNIWLLLVDPEGLTVWLETRPAIRWLLTWAAAPAALFGATLLLTGLKPVRRLVDRLFPDPPAFVATDLEAARGRDMLLINSFVPVFSGRASELAELGKLLELKASRTGFAWRQVLGPSGIGKTRLAIEWLAEAQSRNWDIGIVDPGDRHLLDGWRARRPTALVIDEARALWSGNLPDVMLKLARSASRKQPVRILVLDQVPSAILQRDAADQAALQRGEAGQPLLVDRLGDENIAALIAGRALSDDELARLVAESAGRPRAALIIANIPDAKSYAGALRRWAEMLVPQLARDDETPPTALSVPLIVSALVGPLPTDILRPLLDGFDPGPLLRFFPGESRKSLQQQLPRLVPDDLAEELALRLLGKLDRPLCERVVAVLLAEAPDQLEASLGSIWRHRLDLHVRDDGSSDPAEMLRLLQHAFDAEFPERVAAFHSEAAQLVRTTTNPPAIAVLEQALSRLREIVATRPFDPTTRLREAECAVNAVLQYGFAGKFPEMEAWAQRLDTLPDDPNFVDSKAFRCEQAKGALDAIDRYGNAGRLPDMERWGRRLAALADDPRFEDDPNIRLHDAGSAVNGILYCGRAQDFAGLERWGKRLAELAANPRFAGDPEIRLWDAKGALNAMSRYGAAGRLSDMERWGGRLIALAEDPRFAGDPDIRRQDAGGSVNGILYCGRANDFAGLERWGKRLAELAADPRFAGDLEIRLWDAKSAVNAMSGYGAAGRLSDMERWGGRLIALAEDPRFAGDPDIRRQDAGGAVNAILYCGSAKDFAALERWGERLIGLASDPHFAGNAAIRLEEAKGAVNAMDRYGDAGRLADMERWGGRLTALAEDPRFAGNPPVRLQEAMGAVNAIVYYGRAGLHGGPEERLWKRRLALVAQTFFGNLEIQVQANKFGLTFSAQQRRGWPYGRPGDIC